MGDIMEFPETVEEFMEEYKMVDKHEIYSNGTEYVPIFRMEQWFEHCKIRSANAKRCIDADATLETLKEILIKTAINNVGYKRDVDEVCKDIADNRLSVWLEYVPTADVVEVVHGEWVEKEVVDNTDEDFVWKIEQWQSARCSICGKYHTTPYMYHFDHFNYCPNCGAKMDERRTE